MVDVLTEVPRPDDPFWITAPLSQILAPVSARTSRWVWKLGGVDRVLVGPHNSGRHMDVGPNIRRARGAKARRTCIKNQLSNKE